MSAFINVETHQLEVHLFGELFQMFVNFPAKHSQKTVKHQ